MDAEVGDSRKEVYGKTKRRFMDGEKEDIRVVV